MRTSTQPVLIAFAVLVCSLSIPNTLAQTKSTSSSSISGKVTIKGKPVGGVVVGLRTVDGFAGRKESQLPRATTDQDGIYHLLNVSSGSYQIQLAKLAYVHVDLNEDLGRTIEVGEGENIEDIDFALVKGGVLTGKVTDSEGRPLIEELINIYRQESLAKADTQAQQVIVSSQTDDRGTYRVYGLPAGKYKISAGRGQETRMGLMVGQAASRQVFYPNTEDQSKAEIIELAEGAEISGIDFKLGPALSVFSVTGRVMDSNTGEPIPNFQFGVSRIRKSQFPEVGIADSQVTDAKGEFVIDGLIPGIYSVFIFGESKPARRVEMGGFEIVDQNLTNVAIKLSKGTSISGVVSIENEDGSAARKLAQLQITAIQRGRTPEMAAFQSTNTSQDGGFYISGLGVGRVQLTVEGFDGSETFAITRVERDGIIQPQGIEIKEGEQVTGIQVFVTTGSATLKGVVNLRNGSLPPTGRIFVSLTPIPDRQAVMPPMRVDTRGHFIVEGLFPGEYQVLAAVGMPNSPGPKQVTQQVIVGNGVTEITLTIDLGSEKPSPQP